MLTPDEKRKALAESIEQAHGCLEDALHELDGIARLGADEARKLAAELRRVLQAGPATPRGPSLAGVDASGALICGSRADLVEFGTLGTIETASLALIEDEEREQDLIERGERAMRRIEVADAVGGARRAS